MKKVLFFITIFASVLIIKDLVVSIYTLYHKKDLMLASKEALTKEKTESKKLKLQLSEAQKQSFVEEQARDKLFLVKPGEQIVVMPKLASKEAGPTHTEQKSTWQQWVELFL